jgi:hypothetical protein
MKQKNAWQIILSGIFCLKECVTYTIFFIAVIAARS